MCYPQGYLGTWTASTGTFVSASRPLTQEEAQALATEVTTDPEGRGYAGKSAAEIALLLNSGYTRPNPTPQTNVARTAMPREDFVHAMFAIVAEAAFLPDDDTRKGKYKDFVAMLSPLMQAVNVVDLTDPGLQGLFGHLLADSLVTQEQVDAFTEQPDPTYVSTLFFAPRADLIFATPLVIEPADVTDATGIA